MRICGILLADAVGWRFPPSHSKDRCVTPDSSYGCRTPSAFFNLFRFYSSSVHRALLQESFPRQLGVFRTVSARRAMVKPAVGILGTSSWGTRVNHSAHPFVSHGQRSGPARHPHFLHAKSREFPDTSRSFAIQLQPLRFTAQRPRGGGFPDTAVVSRSFRICFLSVPSRLSLKILSNVHHHTYSC